MKPSRKGVLLMNLGSPDSYEVKDVKRYLTEFLMDKRVLDIPFLLRSWLVRGVIVPRRAPSSAAAYKSIWQEKGSPLIVLTQSLQDALKERLGIPISYVMRYAHPTPAEAFEDLLTQQPDLDEVLLVPLYPQYAMSSFETAVLFVETYYKKKKFPFTLSVLRPYYDDADYIDSLATSIRPYLKGGFDKLLFSYHGVPVRHIYKGDTTGRNCLREEDCCHRCSPAHSFCYRHQCVRTTELVREALGLTIDEVMMSFQSRLGKEEWLKPYTVDTLEQLPREGVRRLCVVCPAFASDCLETLEEIAEEGEKVFLAAGGEDFCMIPCLNVQTVWVDTLERWIRNASAYVYPRLLGDIRASL